MLILKTGLKQITSGAGLITQEIPYPDETHVQ